MNTDKATTPRTIACVAAYVCMGSATWFLVTGVASGSCWALAAGIGRRVGVTAIALVPLAAWAVWTTVTAGERTDLTLAYIGTTAQRFGLLGTVIGIVMATVRIGTSIQEGAATAVTGALPAVGQALVSTAVGFTIAIGCDFVRYLHQQPAGAVSAERAESQTRDTDTPSLRAPTRALEARPMP